MDDATRESRPHKSSYKAQIPNIFEIIKECGTIQYSQLYAKMKEKTGLKMSKHTLNKGLDYLLFSGRIIRETRSGKKNKEVYFSINESVYNNFEKLINNQCQTLSEMKITGDVKYDRFQKTYIDMSLGDLTRSLIHAIARHSQNPKIVNADDELEKYLLTCFVPGILHVAKLASGQLEMSQETASDLLNMYDFGNHTVWMRGEAYKPGLHHDLWSKEEKDAYYNSILKKMGLEEL